MDICKRSSFLFGSEEYVKMRREVVILRENLMNQRYSDLRVRFLCSGSLGEDIAYPTSDDDVMIYKTDLLVVKSQREATQRGDLLMVPSEYSPGYCLLFDVTQTYRSDIYAIDGTYHDIRILTYMEAMCGRGYTIDYKVRHAHAPEYYVPLSAPNALPSPLWILIFTYDPYNVSFDPLTYAYFLECLCYIRLKDQISLRKSIRCFVSRLEDLDFDNCNMDSRMCVGIIKYVQGNSQSACRWLGSAYTMKDTIPDFFLEKLSDSVMTYIACLLNQRFRAENLTFQNRHNN